MVRHRMVLKLSHWAGLQGCNVLVTSVETSRHHYNLEYNAIKSTLRPLSLFHFTVEVTDQNGEKLLLI